MGKHYKIRVVMATLECPHTHVYTVAIVAMAHSTLYFRIAFPSLTPLLEDAYIFMAQCRKLKDEKRIRNFALIPFCVYVP